MSDSPELFVHSAIDDYGLKPVTFRLLAHLWRRAGRDGVITSSKADMARVCALHVDSIETALDDLIDRNIVSEQPRSGQTTIRRINPFIKWKKDPGEENTRGKISLGCVDPLTPTGNNHPPPGRNFHPQRYSSEGTPKKEIHTSFDRFWEKYPRRRNREAALRVFSKLKLENEIDKILPALDNHKRSVGWKAENGKFIPYPAKWLEDRRWEDEFIQIPARVARGCTPPEVSA